ncbi:MAG: hypothetical protein H0V98_10295 [Chloroflexia bacterium]|jgi:hypothetical protein|nr:hypothetical protein [Chloroflexia bacterium]
MHTIQTNLMFQTGQRYLAMDPFTPLAARELVVDRLVHDDLGLLHVVMIDLEGREISTFAEQVEAAIDAGLLVAAEEAVPASA